MGGFTAIGCRTTAGCSLFRLHSIQLFVNTEPSNKSFRTKQIHFAAALGNVAVGLPSRVAIAGKAGQPLLFISPTDAGDSRYAHANVQQATFIWSSLSTVCADELITYMDLLGTILCPDSCHHGESGEFALTLDDLGESCSSLGSRQLNDSIHASAKLFPYRVRSFPTSQCSSR